MTSLLEPSAYQAVVQRVQGLTRENERAWGEMSASQAMAHCTVGLSVANGTLQIKRSMLGRLIGGLIKKKVLAPKPWKQGLPTDKRFLVEDPGTFEGARDALLAGMARFHTDGAAAPSATHPFFGSFTREQWGQLHWKHLDHHLRQFGA